MTQATKGLILLSSFFFAAGVFAAPSIDPECLNHPGGGLGDVECYGSLSNDLVADNKAVYGEIMKTIPAKNANASKLREYMATQEKNLQFCQLKMQAASAWKPDPSTPLLNMYDAIYAECVYDSRRQQNKFLHDVLDSARQ